mgnify:CR=1 FL=1
MCRIPIPEIKAHAHLPNSKRDNRDADEHVQEVLEAHTLSAENHVADLTEHALKDGEEDECEAEGVM